MMKESRPAPKVYRYKRKGTNIRQDRTENLMPSFCSHIRYSGIAPLRIPFELFEISLGGQKLSLET